MDYRPKGSDDSTCIDIALVNSKYSADVVSHIKPSYYRLLAIFEVKKGKGKTNIRTVVIKDVFAFAKPIASQDNHDEVKMLKKIWAIFQDNNPNDILFPKIVVGSHILHWDISDNNILVVRKNGTVCRLLIDFDCAIDISEAKKGTHGKVTGTFPFMSLNNLTKSDVMCTSLDDWELMLYLLCWYAMIGFGANDKCLLVQESLEKLPIAQW
ncbi:hypothetical protein H4S07_000973 [Coemansia furcata]|uniref:Uncharacterized protein n=1 Tax=Coemansia furcata TaxID=417177 RepID=A0ACC1LPS8_9FUNG|nr:hypothetical protein H4S07_000973 [Coemansia furcata]